ncbi:uncharacterized protein LOC117318690 [Pecten maximus]|uniref:uncharacterized protein LOC117318690 n=1 Tax=Pecten maximus TaxID=6579 RepID=UPI0014586239|nr:uncharacterized protein LOC117318690 [Pecten maximus]
MEQNIYGKFELTSHTKKDGSTETSLSSRLNSQTSISVNLFNGVVYVHIKKEKKYYLPLTLDEYQDLTDLRGNLEDNLYLINQGQNQEESKPKPEQGSSDVRHVLVAERRMHPYTRKSQSGAGAGNNSYADEFDQYLQSSFQ